MGRWAYCGLALLILLAVVVSLTGCGGGTSKPLVQLDIKNLTPLNSASFQYTAWVESAGRTQLLDTFVPDQNGDINFSRFAFVDNLQTGNRVFVTIEPNPSPQPNVPSNTRILDGTISGSSAVMTFPQLQGFVNATGQTRVTGSLNNDLQASFQNLPDISSLNLIYQGFVKFGNNTVALTQFNANEVPVSNAVAFDLTNASYFLSIQPKSGAGPQGRPLSLHPFFTNGNLQLGTQALVKSSLTPGSANFMFPSGLATIR